MGLGLLVGFGGFTLLWLVLKFVTVCVIGNCSYS